LHITPNAHLQHQVLIRRARDRAGIDELVERALLLAGSLLRADRGFPVTPRRARWAEEAQLALREEPELSLRELAAMLGLSMYHLSRLFRAATGFTVSQYRMRVRLQLAVDRIAGGEANLARLASDVGFADQSHMTRSLRHATNMTPRLVQRL